MSCQEGGFTSMRYNNLRDLTAKMLAEVCRDTNIEPKLTALMVEELESRTGKTTNEGRLDIRTHVVWERGQQPFPNLRVSNPSAYHCFNKSLQQCHVMNEQKRKRENKTGEFYKLNMIGFHHWFPSIYENIGRECHAFY